jgi:hypothetical protein
MNVHSVVLVKQPCVSVSELLIRAWKAQDDTEVLQNHKSPRDPVSVKAHFK